MSEIKDPYEDQLAAARYRAERDQARQELAGLMKSGDDLDDENEHLRDMLNDVAWKLGIGHVVHYYSEDNYQECHKRVLDEIRKLTGPTSYDVAQVTTSAYDLLSEADRDAIAWVRDHGGLDHVRDEWRSRVPYDKHEMARQRLIDHIAECETALGRRRQRIDELVRRVGDLVSENAELRKRAMPEGMEWPRFEDGEPVRLGDEFECWCGKTHTVESVTIREGRSALNASKPHMFVVSDGPFTAHGKRVKRPAPKALDADGVEIRVGDSVWGLQSAIEYVVDGFITDGSHGACTVKAHYVDGLEVAYLMPSLLAHSAPAIAADGRPLREGETVWHKMGHAHGTVESIDADSLMHTVRYRGDDGSEYRDAAKDLTHQRPVADTWERLEEDAEKDPCGYFGFDGEETCGRCPASGKNCEQTMARDLVRRAKKLAGVSE